MNQAETEADNKRVIARLAELRAKMPGDRTEALAREPLIQTEAEAHADNKRVIARLTILRAKATAAAAASLRIAAAAEEDWARNITPAPRMEDRVALWQLSVHCEATTDARNEAFSLHCSVMQVESAYRNAFEKFNEAAQEYNKALAGAKEKAAVMRTINRGLTKSATVEKLVLLAHDAQELREISAAVDASSAAEARFDAAMAVVDVTEAEIDRWRKIMDCYDCAAVSNLHQAIMDAEASAISISAALFALIAPKAKKYVYDDVSHMALVNQCIDQGLVIDIHKHAIKMNNSFAAHGVKKHVVVCCVCGAKYGMKRCSGCSSPARYCSRECQAAVWPKHKAACGMK
jgi:hypothetical protein